tara:strand:- start:112 stop:399 length:288 start_codon:yes stop_codon:yes gene_type:complete
LGEFVSTSDYRPVVKLFPELLDSSDYKKPVTPCNATVHFDSGTKILHHKCCLFKPHTGWKHSTLSLLLTCGGERATHDIHGKDITKTWSPYREKI